MKSIAILLILLLSLQSCYKQNCGCVIKCTSFSVDTIEICSNSYSNAAIYQAAYDSLMQKYYAYVTRDTILKSVYIGDGFEISRAEQNKMNELETEGYTCTCAAPK